MGLTVSFSMGSVAVKHDIRQAAESNVDASLTYRDEIMIDKLKDFGYDIYKYTDARFRPYIDEYNEIVSRPCRRKTEPYSQILEATNEKRAANKTGPRPTKIAYEFVLQVGNQDTNPASADRDEDDIELNRILYREILKEIQRQYPHAEILLATYHADEPEGTPHLHILVQFVGEGYERGLSHQISISRALECDGIERAAKRHDDRYQMEAWVEEVKDNIMEPLMKDIMHEDREIIGDSRSRQNIHLFRKSSIDEDRYMEKEREEHQEELNRMEEQKGRLDDEIIDKNQQISQADDEIRKKKAVAEELDSDIERKLDQSEALGVLEAIDGQIADIEERLKKAKRQDKDPEKMILKVISEKKSITGKITQPESVVVSRKNFNKLKQRSDDYMHMNSILKDAKKLMQAVVAGIKQLVGGRETQERIEAKARASEIVKEKDQRIEKLEDRCRDLEYDKVDMDEVLMIERKARNTSLSPDTWREYIQTIDRLGECIPKDTLDDLLGDIERFIDCKDDQMKDIMDTVKEYRSTMDRSLEQSGDDMLQERLRLLEEAFEKSKKERRKHKEISYEEYDIGDL